MIDPDTPQEAYSFTDYVHGKQWDLVFSDEFNVDGRTFYPGDDPYWEAVDLNYWQTEDLEWVHFLSYLNDMINWCFRQMV